MSYKKNPTTQEEVTFVDVTPPGYGPGGDGSDEELVTPEPERLPGESSDQARARAVGYQVDNGIVGLFEVPYAGWRATVFRPDDERPHVIGSYKKQQVINEVYRYLFPPYFRKKA